MGPMNWSFRGGHFVLGPRPLVMGIVNVTPDSFSDGGRFNSADAAIEHGLRLAAEGADLLDVGGESSRPGSAPVPLEEELARVVPVVRGLAGRVGVPISVDTTKAEVARQALAAGAAIVNDITAGLGDPDMAAVAGEAGAGVVLMHMQGTPATMQLNPTYADVVGEVRDFLAARVRAWVAGGVPAERIAIDPGIGFGKTSEHNRLLLKHLDVLAALGRPVLLGVSRKGFLGRLTGRPVTDRLPASLAAACYCVTRGTAHILRVHDVAATADAARVLGALIP
jgi:dihydropteroate synthase